MAFLNGLPVLSLGENMLMQIDANDVVLYMQISHATILWLLFFKDRQTLVNVHMWMQASIGYIWAHVWYVCEKLTTSTRLQIESILSPINLKVLAGFTA